MLDAGAAGAGAVVLVLWCCGAGEKGKARGGGRRGRGSGLQGTVGGRGAGMQGGRGWSKSKRSVSMVNLCSVGTSRQRLSAFPAPYAEIKTPGKKNRKCEDSFEQFSISQSR